MDQTAYQRRWLILAVLSITMVIAVLDTTILNVALPSIQREFHADAASLQWVIDAFTLALAGLMVTAGAWGDRFGRKRALMVGLAVFGTCAVLGAYAPGMGALIAARGGMGVGGALVMPSTLSLIPDVFPDPNERAKAIAIWSAGSGLGTGFGPTLGGFLLSHFWWGSVLLVNVPVAVIGIVAVGLLVPESRAPDARRLDIPGSALSIVGLGLLVWSIIDAPHSGWGSGSVLGALTCGLVVLGGFAWWELHTPTPMLDVRFFRNPRFSAAVSAVTLVMFALSGCVYFMSYYIQDVLGYSPLQTGVHVIPIMVGFVIGAPLAMTMARRHGEKVPTVAGLVTIVVCMLFVSTTTVTSGYPHLVVTILLFGFGISLTLGPATEAIMGAIPRSKAGVGSAINDTTREVGGALGIAVFGSVLNSVYQGRMSGATTGLTPDQASAARDGIPGAVTVAAHLPGGAPHLVAAARESFVHAMDVTVLVAAVIAVGGVLIAALWLPHRAARPGADAEALDGAPAPSPGPTSPGPAAEPVAADALAASAGEAPRGGRHRAATRRRPARVATAAAFGATPAFSTGGPVADLLAMREWQAAQTPTRDIPWRSMNRRTTRDLRTDGRIVQTVAALLRGGEFPALSVPDIADAARVPVGELVRRYRSREEMALDAVGVVRGSPYRLPDSGWLQGDLEQLCAAVAAAVASPEVTAFLALPTHDHTRADYIAGVRRVLLTASERAAWSLYHRAVRRHEVAPGVDPGLLADTVVCLALMRATADPPQPSTVDVPWLVRTARHAVQTTTIVPTGAHRAPAETRLRRGMEDAMLGYTLGRLV